MHRAGRWVAAALATAMMGVGTACGGSSASGPGSASASAAVSTARAVAPSGTASLSAGSPSSGASGPGATPSPVLGDWHPDFALLPTSAAAAHGGAHLDLSAKGVDVYRNFLRLPIPRNACPLMSLTVRTPKAVADQAQKLVTCLVNSWRPVLATEGMQILTPTVDDCAILPARATAKDREACATGDADKWITAWTWSGGTHLTLTRQAGRRGESALWLSEVLAHEVGHVVQAAVAHRIRGGAWDDAVPADAPAGLVEPDDYRMSRRLESQAECLGTGMLNWAHPTSVAQLEAAKVIRAHDIAHFDLVRARYWSGQGLTERVANCNTGWAASDLLAFTGSAIPK